MTEPLARSDARMSHDGAAGTQRRQNVARRSRWHAATPECRMTEPLARSDAKKSLDEAAGTQRSQKVARARPLARSDAKKSLGRAGSLRRTHILKKVSARG